MLEKDFTSEGAPVLHDGMPHIRITGQELVDKWATGKYHIGLRAVRYEESLRQVCALITLENHVKISSNAVRVDTERFYMTVQDFDEAVTLQRIEYGPLLSDTPFEFIRKCIKDRSHEAQKDKGIDAKKRVMQGVDKNMPVCKNRIRLKRMKP